MSLTKNDLKQIRTVIKEEISISEKKLGKKIEDEVGGLAAMTAREFNKIYEKFNDMNKKFEAHDKKLNQIVMGIANLEFIATEMVRRDEFLEVKQRLDRLEKIAGFRK